jgi:hypothetical protein
MIVRNYAFYSLNQFKYHFKRKFQHLIQNTKEHKILNTFGNPFHSFKSKKELSSVDIRAKRNGKE